MGSDVTLTSPDFSKCNTVAAVVAQEHGLTLCAEEHVKSCDGCSRCAASRRVVVGGSSVKLHIFLLVSMEMWTLDTLLGRPWKLVTS